MRTNSSGRAGQFFGRSLMRAAAVGLPFLLLTLPLAPVASASGPYPPRFILPALRQPQARPGFGPAIAFYSSQRFYLAWTGSATSKVFYSAYGSNCKHFSLTPCWAPQATVSGPWGHALASESPALVDYGSDLYAFWPGLATRKVFYSAYNGSSWGAEATVSGSWGTATTDLPVALAVYNGKLYAAWAPRGHWGRSVIRFSMAPAGLPARWSLRSLPNVLSSQRWWSTRATCTCSGSPKVAGLAIRPTTALHGRARRA